MRRWGWLPALLALLALWALNASRPGARVEGCPEGCARGERREGPLRVLSLNMLHGFPRFRYLEGRLRLLAGEIERLDPDVVLLQEVPWRPGIGPAAAWLGQTTGRNHLYLRANGNRRTILFEEGEAVLSRFPLSDPRFIELQPRVGYFEHRVALRVTVHAPQGAFDVVVTHLTNGPDPLNRAQAASLQAFVSRDLARPTLVAGDFNAEEDSPQIRALSAAWRDAFRLLHPDLPGLTCCVDDLRAGEEEPLEKRIDYLFLVDAGGRAWRAVSVERAFDHPWRLPDGPLWVSDHLGLYAELELTP